MTGDFLEGKCVHLPGFDSLVNKYFLPNVRARTHLDNEYVQTLEKKEKSADEAKNHREERTLFQGSNLFLSKSRSISLSFLP